MESGMNTLQKSLKNYNFTLYVSTLGDKIQKTYKGTFRKLEKQL